MNETKTVQAYPSEAVINATIEEYVSFGWKVADNRRCHEFDGAKQHFLLFNNITFCRERDELWYDEVSQLEKEYIAARETIKTYQDCKPVLKISRPEGALAILPYFLLYCFFIVPGIIYSVVKVCKKSKIKKNYEKALAAYNEIYPLKISELNEKLAELRARAEKYIFKSL